MKLQGTLIRVEPNGFGVVQLDKDTGSIGVFTSSDRAPAANPSAFRLNARVTADAEERHGQVQYLSNVEVKI